MDKVMDIFKTVRQLSNHLQLNIPVRLTSTATMDILLKAAQTLHVETVNGIQEKKERQNV